MKQLTIRGVDLTLSRTLKEKAGRRGWSVNRYVLYLLREAVGLGPRGQPPTESYHGLDDLAPGLRQNMRRSAGSWLPNAVSTDDKVYFYKP